MRTQKSLPLLDVTTAAEAHNRVKERHRLRRQRLAMLTYYERKAGVVEELDAEVEAQSIVRGLLTRGQ